MALELKFVEPIASVRKRLEGRAKVCRGKHIDKTKKPETKQKNLTLFRKIFWENSNGTKTLYNLGCLTIRSLFYR